MIIKIAQRLTPYSHELGSYCLLPKTPLRFQIFPTLIRVHDLSLAHPKSIIEIPINLQGPIQNFTIQQNLEKAEIKVWGQSRNGFFRYRCLPSERESMFSFVIEKEPKDGLILSALPEEKARTHACLYETLSFGSHKAQDWTLMNRRESMLEILPIWFRLGQQVPERPYHPSQGTTALLSRCEERIQARERGCILSAFTDLFHTGFEGMLSPRLLDEDHQGYDLPALLPEINCSPLELLRRGAQLIRSLFIHSHDEGVSLLPALPPEFISGRLINLYSKGIGKIDLEWSKGVLRRVIVHADTDGAAHFYMQNELKQFRLKSSDSHETVVLTCGNPFPIQKGYLYYLDNFTR
jgi:hypothetical protein